MIYRFHFSNLAECSWFELLLPAFKVQRPVFGLVFTIIVVFITSYMVWILTYCSLTHINIVKFYTNNAVNLVFNTH